MNPTFRVSSGLISPDHMRRMGSALKVFLWCINRQTDAAGIVMFGRPVLVSTVGSSIKLCDRSVRSHFKRLQSQGYIKLLRRPAGLVIWVLNQKKWSISDRQKVADHRKEGSAESCRSDRQKVADLSIIRHLKLTPEEEQGLIHTTQIDRPPSIPVEIRQGPTIGFTAQANLNRPCSRCGGSGASGTPWLCPSCADLLRQLQREAGYGVPEVLA